MARKTGLGKLLIKEAVNAAIEKFGAEKIEIGAQIQAQGFYEKCGFKVTDNEYVEDGIPHVMMYMQL